MKIKECILVNFKNMTTKLEAQWIVGFVDGEGCFNIDIHKKSDMQWQLQMQPEFVVVQNEVDIQILHALKEYFQCGSVGINRRDSSGTRYHYRVKSVKNIVEKILPFFEKHSLKTKKKIEFQRFRRICLLMNKGYHRESLHNFLEIYDLAVNLRVRSRAKKVTSRIQSIENIISDLRKTLLDHNENVSKNGGSAHSESSE
jgi:hypothetical protein